MVPAASYNLTYAVLKKNQQFLIKIAQTYQCMYQVQCLMRARQICWIFGDINTGHRYEGGPVLLNLSGPVKSIAGFYAVLIYTESL